MKKILFAALISFVLFSCTDTKKQEETLLNEVIKIHDQVMAKDELVMTNKMQLDTLLKQNINQEVTAGATGLTKQLDTANE
jgi:GTPase involved in cell partitioning and DNA repair